MDADGSVNLGDAVAFLRYFFARGATPSCQKSADSNDDGVLNVADAVGLLLHLFGGAEPLPPPSLDCGGDPTPDNVSCTMHPPCL